MLINEEEHTLMHYGILRKSGRYPWGSGHTPAERSKTFFSARDELRRQGLSDTEIAEGWGMNTQQLRDTVTIAKSAKKAADITTAQRLANRGYSNTAIGDKMGINESSVRALRKPGEMAKLEVLRSTANVLREQVGPESYVDIGVGSEHWLGISKTKLGSVVAILKDEGYEPITTQIDQLGTGSGKKTLVKVLAPKGTTYLDVKLHPERIQTTTKFTEDGGRTYFTPKPPLSIDSRRIGINYAEDGGKNADGVLWIRPGVSDVSIGKARYAQVRVAVDGTHYLKGMAVYNADLPAGKDIVFNTNKDRTSDPHDVMKPMKRDKDGNIDPENPFGSSIKRQLINRDEHGKEHLTSTMNIVNEEGDWEDWHRSLSSQILSKQSPHLAKEQLDLKYESKKNELDTITSLTNPVVRKKLLDTFADNADSSAVHLEAAQMPRQSNHVILPIKSLKENEVYAPTFNNGETVVLIRHPHGGIFEIPELRVNNRNVEAKRLLSQGDQPARDAIGIHPKVAQKLSGADFDGDAVLVISNTAGKIKTAASLERLKNFDPQREYPEYPGMKVISDHNKQVEMGRISNLITDMTIKNASPDEIARAVRHSMVVIDAEKHKLNYKESAARENIAQLKTKYQGGPKRGASTIVSRAKSEERVPRQKLRRASEGGPVDKKTGELVYVRTGEGYTDKHGRPVIYKQLSTKMAETKDARTLISEANTPIERIYADHANKLKALANTARRESVNTPNLITSPSARVAYKPEVERLKAALVLAQRNSPRERQAQLLANILLSTMREANPDMTKDDYKKAKARALNTARSRVGAGKHKIEISPNEWAAIQSGAISHSMLKKIIDNADLEQVKKLATPRENTVMTSIKQRQASSLLARGYTQAEVAQDLGVSVSTLASFIKTKEAT